MPVGIAEAEADWRMGSPPDSVASTRGVLITPITMLAENNTLARQQGAPQDDSLRRWDCEGVRAVVVVDHNGIVAGRWTFGHNQ